jgi:hypothetical protein
MGTMLNFDRPSSNEVKRAFEYNSRLYGELNNELDFMTKELEKLYDSPQPSSKEREQIQELQENLYAKGNQAMAIMGRMEALAWSLGTVAKTSEGTPIGVGLPMVGKSLIHKIR